MTPALAPACAQDGSLTPGFQHRTSGSLTAGPGDPRFQLHFAPWVRLRLWQVKVKGSGLRTVQARTAKALLPRRTATPLLGHSGPSGPAPHPSTVSDNLGVGRKKKKTGTEKDSGHTARLVRRSATRPWKRRNRSYGCGQDQGQTQGGRLAHAAGRRATHGRTTRSS